MAELIPEAYARYRPVIEDALLFFLEHLPPTRLLETLAEQMRMPPGARPGRRMLALLHQCPTLHKMGQVVARHRSLEPAFRRRLQRLETMPPVTPLSRILPVIEQELPDLAAQGVRLARRALAEASVALVLPFSVTPPRRRRRFGAALGCGGDGKPGQGVLKVLKPGIEDRLDEELGVWPELGSFLDERCEHYRLPFLDYRETFETMRTLLAQEVRLDQEQRHLSEAAEVYRNAPCVRVPALLPYCTRRITAMERIWGRKVTDVDGMPSKQRRRLADRITDTLLAQPMWSEQKQSLFHADPHAGNLMVTPSGELGVLDWSLAGRLTKQDRVQVTQIVLGGVALEAGRIRDAVAALAQSTPDTAALETAAGRAVDAVRSGTLPGLQWLIGLLDDAVVSAHVGFPPHLLMFRKMLLTLEGVIGDVSPESSPDPRR